MRENLESRIPDSAAYQEWFEAATPIMAAALIFAVLVATGVLS